MRPVLLDMEGFAAFRSATRVDFQGADFFVLVGPTGSGKSTVIDAVTFALYGTVPRWQDRRKVSLALAPTAVRGTVRLVFDVGGARYQVARELRRSGGANPQVHIKNARLERLLDPTGLGDVGEPTELLAADSAVNERVTALLGLGFEHFCKCVSLPQGAFAEFLHAKPSDRHQILIDLLGLRVYEAIARRAREAASTQRQLVTLLAEQLEGFGDVTADTQQAADERVTRLTDLAATTDEAVPRLAQATAAVTAKATQGQRLTDERTQLLALVPPDGLAELDERRAAAERRLTDAVAEQAAADTAETAARDASAVAPERGPLEQAQRDHRDLAAAVADEPGANDACRRARSAAEAADAATRAADRATSRAREGQQRAVTEHEAADSVVDRLTADLAPLAGVRPPPGLSDLGARLADAQRAHRAAITALASAERADDDARAAAEAAAAGRGRLEQAGRDHDELAELLAAQPGRERRHTDAAREHAAALAAATAGRAHLEHAQEARDAAAREDLAAALRPQLAVGDDCPVCAQQVAVLPTALSGDRIEQADTALTAAASKLREAEGEAAQAERAAGKAADERDQAAARIDALRQALSGAPDSRAVVDEQLAVITALTAAADLAAAGRRTARDTLKQATDLAGAARDEEQAASRRLRDARDPLVALDAPQPPDDVVAGWEQLHAWASAQATDRERRLKPASRAAKDAAAARQEADNTLKTTEAAADTARREQLAATGAAAREQANLDALTATVARLTGTLQGAPDAATVTCEVARLDALDAAVSAADPRVRAARTQHGEAQQALRAVAGELEAGWQQLRHARDPLVRFDAPILTGGDLTAAWRQLTTWATGAAQDRVDQLTGLGDDLSDLERTRDDTAAELAGALADAGVEVRADVPLADVATAAVASALATAHAERRRLAERRDEAAGLEERRAGAERAAQVAVMLAGLLRNDNFPRWLASSALDTLVMEASQSLLTLSSGQFELTHDDGGEFLIVDHADADSRRPVRTLSGGETFQASLALALALSSQMAALADAGAARLDSIFLDEGFGTLDESTLETVAETLDNLAHQGDRMVGVVTHVGALAERIPTRFTVSRDQITSSVVRSGA